MSKDIFTNEELKRLKEAQAEKKKIDEEVSELLAKQKRQLELEKRRLEAQKEKEKLESIKKEVFYGIEGNEVEEITITRRYGSPKSRRGDEMFEEITLTFKDGRKISFGIEQYNYEDSAITIRNRK